MILHLNRSQRAAVIRALDYRLAKITARRKSDALKEHDEADEVLLVMVRNDVIAGRTAALEAV